MAVLSTDRLPLGFRFRPTDEELINHYLRLKINGRDSEVEVIPEVDVCKWEPWDLPGLSVIKTEDPEWFFFCPRDRKYPNGQRSNRATDAGYWKATGKDRTIKSRGPNQSMIGMKKTLVFYRGRAPKGQRTHWIMHEYRPTIEELDGTAPGQSAFVLCRLFRKPELKIDSQKYDEEEHSGSSPTTSKSSPDGTASDLVQEAETSSMLEGKETEETKKQFDRLNNMAPNALVPVQSCSNTHMTSDGEDPLTFVTPMNEYLQLDENSDMFNPMYDQIGYKDQIDCKIFSPTQSQFLTELTSPYMDLPYASDFGNDHNGLQFRNVTFEEDVSFSDLLVGVFTNNDECSGEESTSQKNSVVDSGTQLPSQACVLETSPLEYSYSKGNDIYSHSLQHDPGMGAARSYGELLDSKELLQLPASIASWPLLGEESRCNVGGLGNIYFEQNSSSAYSAMGSLYDICNNVDGSIKQDNPLEYGSSANGTGIKIVNHQPEYQPNSNNFGTQGTASRRIRLQMGNSLRSIDNCEANDSIYFANEDEVLPSLTEASKIARQTAMPGKSVDGKTTDVGGAGVKIRTHITRRIRRRRISDNSVTHPPRSLQSKTNYSSSETVDNDKIGNTRYGKIGNASCGEDEDGVQSALTEATEAAGHDPTFKSENETQLPKIESSYKETADELSGELRSRSRSSQYDDCGRRQIEPPSFTKAPSPILHSRSSSRVYSGSIFFVVVISMISIGIWMYGR